MDGAALALVAVAAGWNVARSARRRRLRLVQRIRPYVEPSLGGSHWSVRVPADPSWAGVLRVLALRLGRRLDRTLGGSMSVRRRLIQLGGATEIDQFRVEQLTWAGAGLLGALLLSGAVMARGGRVSPVAVAVLAIVLCVAGALGRDRLLTVQVAQRERRMLAELPAVAEMLALSVGAGEGVAGALERVSRIARGALADELRRTLVEARTGTSMVDALTRMAGRCSSPALARFVDGIVVAVDRGTPLADVLRAQAGDVREERRRALLDVGGRKEIAMLFPVVFLVLPVTVVFALYPGFANLSLAVS
jgi:tight adherence protein C